MPRKGPPEAYGKAWRVVQRTALPLPPSLYKCLGTTHVIESPQSGIQKRAHNATHWSTGDVFERGVASAWLPTEKHFRKVIGDRDLGDLPSSSEENQTKRRFEESNVTGNSAAFNLPLSLEHPPFTRFTGDGQNRAYAGSTTESFLFGSV
jgi:hypothetical protein